MENVPVIEARSLCEILAHRASTTGSTPAFRICGADVRSTTDITYAELDLKARSVAAQLIAAGLCGSRLVLWYPTGIDFIVAFFGTLYAGSTAVPLALSYSDKTLPRLETTLEDIQPGAILTTSAIAAASAGVRARSDVLGRQRLVTIEAAAVAGQSGVPHMREQEIAVLQYTSGSTSWPKGVQVSHANLLRNAAALQAASAFEEGELAVSWLPMFHDMGLVGGVVLPVIAGGTNILLHPAAFIRKPALWLQAISHFGASVSGAPNFGYEHCIDRVKDPELDSVDLSRWRVAFSGSEPVRARTLSRFAERFAFAGFNPAAYMPSYGLAEATLFVSGGSERNGPQILSLDRAALMEGAIREAGPSDVNSAAFVSCGRPHREQRIEIVDPARQRPSAPGEIGEIWLCGPHVAMGYHERPEETKEVFAAQLAEAPGDLFLRTGDLGFLRDGELYVTGRLKDLIIVRGANHYPQDLEEVATAASGELVPGAAAAFMDDEDEASEGGVALVAEVRRGSELSLVRTCENIRRAVAVEHGLSLGTVVLVPEGALPRTSSGKIQRALTRTLLRSDALSPLVMWSASVAPSRRGLSLISATEEQIAGVWQDVLGHSDFDQATNFFEAGGDSLTVVALQAELEAAFGRPFSLADVFDNPTVASLASSLDRPLGEGIRLRRRGAPQVVDDRIAIVGVSCRVPGAENADEFWRNLVSGDVAIRSLSDIDLTDAGVSASLLHHPDYVRAFASITRASAFDAEYFGYSPTEARWIDPQQRVLLECAVEALEDGGCDPDQFDGVIGVYAGCGLNFAQLARLLAAAQDPESHDQWLALLGSDKDYLATRIAYKLDLRGPAVAVQTACSTSLVAVHLACQGLRARECDAALAGGVSITNDGALRGYRYVPGDAFSADGTVRPFDSRASGTVFGDGAGLVLLKRLEDAVADGDHIRAVIRGSSVNNDGASKVGFTAPSVSGQAAAISDALERAGVAPSSIGLLETHGTGTPLGDPIEFAALVRAFGPAGASEPCRLGATKANVSHLNAAAGVIGLVKASLAVEHGLIPPVSGYAAVNPNVALANSAFTIPLASEAWPVDLSPRRAGVSAFGFGGTNAHVVLEQAPALERTAASRNHHVLLLSHRTRDGLDAACERLASHLRETPELEMADVAYTLAVGRRRFRHRRAIVCSDREEAIAALLQRRGAVHSRERGRARAPTVYMFPGQGAQRHGMGAQIYAQEPVFRAAIDECAAFAFTHLGRDLRSVMFDSSEGAQTRLSETDIAQPALFAMSYALARQWEAWGVIPDAMVGHSLGELVAACIAGVFSLQDAVRIVTRRGQLMQSMPRGAMVAVVASRDDLDPWVATGLSIAAENARNSCVLSGPTGLVESAIAELSKAGYQTTKLRTSHAFHSPAMTEAAAGLVRELADVSMSPPRIPFVSSVSGDWITPEEATSAEYWSSQLLRTVRFADALCTLQADLPGALLLEVGVGQTLTSLAALVEEQGWNTLVTLPTGRLSEPEHLARAAAACAAAGGGIDLGRLYAEERRRRVPLPTYPFQGHADRSSESTVRPVVSIADPPVHRSSEGTRLFSPTWKRRPCGTLCPSVEQGHFRVAIFGGRGRLTDALQRGLENLDFGHSAHDVRVFEDDPGALAQCSEEGWGPTHIIWLSEPTAGPKSGSGDPGAGQAFHRLLRLGQTLAGRPVELLCLTVNAQNVMGDELTNPEAALPGGLCRSMRAESPQLRCRTIDLERGELRNDPDKVVRTLLADLLSGGASRDLAVRGGALWEPVLEPIILPPPPAVAHRGAVHSSNVYLITGGLGGLGHATAIALARNVGAELILVGRRPMPDREHWPALLVEPEGDKGRKKMVARMLELEELGTRVSYLPADVCDRTSLTRAVALARERHGRIHGLIHTAGVSSPAQLLNKTAAECDEVLAPKVRGLLNIEAIFRDEPLDQLVLFSSICAIEDRPGLADYAAANAFLDTFAQRGAHVCARHVLSINWDLWSEAGMAHDLSVSARHEATKTALLAGGLRTAEAQSALLQVLDSTFRQVCIFASPPPANGEPPRGAIVSAVAVGPAPRPDLGVAYAAPSNDLEASIAQAIAGVLNIDRVGLDDDFFELGGHSLLGMRLAAEIRDTTGADVDLEALFERPTARALAAQVAATEWEEVEI